MASSSKSSSKIEEIKEFVRAESSSLNDDLLEVASTDKFVKLDLQQRVDLGTSIMARKTEIVKGLPKHVFGMIRSHNVELDLLDDIKRTWEVQ